MENKKSIKNISIFGAFALSIGTAIGWGSFVVTGSSYVSKAGPMGSMIGLIIGMLIMIVVAYNYHYMMNKYPGTNGGIYSFAKHTFGPDHAFLLGWFLIITYSAILWANVSSFALFARYLFGTTFQFGFHYSIGGYDVWLGELLLSTFFLCLFGGICLLNKKITTRIQFGFALIFISLILAGFIIAAIMHQGGVDTYMPHFAPNGENEFIQVMRIVTMTPWAFIGFESISHSSKNFSFSQKKVFKVFLISLVVATIMYFLCCMMCISAFPSQYNNWYEYLTSSEKLDGYEGVPAFYVIHHYIGVGGVVMFAIALFAILATSIIGNIYALCGLINSMADDGIFPKFLTKKDNNDANRYIVLTMMALAFVMLFFGRVLIGWIVDIDTICATIIYTYIAAIAVYQARKDENKKALTVGIIGLVIGGAFTIFLTVTSIISIDWMEKEAVLIFFVWAILGFVFYVICLKRDKKKMFGHSMAPVFAFFALIIYSIGTYLAHMVKIYQALDITVGGIIACIIITIGTQVIFFYVFGIIRKREVEMQEKLVFGMATMVEGRDTSTGGHIRRTSKVVELLVREMIRDDSFSAHHRFYTNVVKAAPMHDLGKITVDDAVLRKPGKFTDEEYAQMKKHSPEGAKIVKNILDGGEDNYFEEIAINVAHYHHERWDGRGYPEGLKGEEIPLEARIMAIADVYDALVSKRVYKDAFTFDDANKIILDGMGSQFDPGLKKYYLAAKDKIEAFYKENK